MAEEISIDLTDQEQIMSHVMTMIEESATMVSNLSSAIESYKGLSSKGSFKDIYLGEGNDGFARYILKAQDIVTLIEVLYTHVENTYSSMIDTDKLLAVRIVNQYYLNNPSVSQEDKEYIRSHPQEALEEIKKRHNLTTEQKKGK